MYSINDAKELIELARKSILSEILSKQTPNGELKKKYNKKQGVFVTLNKKGELRGCIGFPLPHYTLYDGIVHCAKAAAFEDPRFMAVNNDEFKEVSIEISILTVPEEIIVNEKEELLDNIKIGRDGLIIKNGLNSGLLLPQVFVEYDANPKKALDMLCEKAGLAHEAWKGNNVKIESFQAQVFKEISPEGEVIEEKLE